MNLDKILKRNFGPFKGPENLVLDINFKESDDEEEVIYDQHTYNVNIFLEEKKENGEKESIGHIQTYFEYFDDEYLEFNDRDNLPYLHCYISYLYIEKKYRKKGYGTLLLTYVEENAIRMAKDIAQDMAQDMAQDIAQDMAQDMAQDTAQENKNRLIQNLYMTLSDVSELSKSSDGIYSKQGFEICMVSKIGTSMEKKIKINNL
jgi:GNAT superfamily N-acetyltransferase